MIKEILTTGMSGLVGTRVSELLSPDFSIEDLSLNTGVDITDYSSVADRVESSPAKVILHMAAMTDVDRCEDEKILGEEAPSWMVNVTGTQNIVNAAKKSGKKIIYISTDFVFDGTKEYYSEDDMPNPVNWYGNTKYEGELRIKNSGLPFIIARIAYPYRSRFEGKKDFFRRILERMENKEKVQALTDHYITPTFIDDIAESLKQLIQRDLQGIYHIVGSGSMSVYEAAGVISDVFGVKADIGMVKRSEYFRDKAFRPLKLRLKNDKITELGITMHSFPEGLEIVKKQMLESLA